MEQKQDVTQMTDLELAKIQGQVYQELLKVQANLTIVTNEIEKRIKVSEPKV